MQMSEVISSACAPILSSPETVNSNRALFLRQKQLLDTFLSHGAITPAQYNKSLSNMQKKMLIK